MNRNEGASFIQVPRRHALERAVDNETRRLFELSKTSVVGVETQSRIGLARITADELGSH